MTKMSQACNRRTAIRAGGVAFTTLAVGIGTGTPVSANNGPPTMNVDLPPTITSSGRGQVVAAIYPGGDRSPSEVIHDDELDGFRLGPDDTDVEHNGAEAVRYRLVNNGVHGEAVGAFFDATTADTWFDRGNAVGKLSAIRDDKSVIAWGSDEVTIR